jgi:hypothetical protein
MSKFKFLKILNSPFKLPRVKLYVGKIAIGTPYFLPRRAIKDPDKPGWLKFVPKKIGFDFVALGWKTKWSDTDYRFEWGPTWSFVFWKWQIALKFLGPDSMSTSHYWEAWLYYKNHTSKNKPIKTRVRQLKKQFPQTSTIYRKGKEEETINYYDIILKKKYNL